MGQVSYGVHACKICGQLYEASAKYRKLTCSFECGYAAHKAYRLSQRPLGLLRYAEKKATQPRRVVHCIVCLDPFCPNTKAQICSIKCKKVRRRRYKMKTNQKLKAMDAMSNMAKMVQGAKTFREMSLFTTKT